METIYLICAAVGGTLLVCQVLLGLFGLGHHDVGADHDFDHDTSVGHDHDHDQHHGSSWYVGVLSFRTLVTAITFFGLGGLAALEATGDAPFALGVALLAGLGSLLAVMWMMKALLRLKADGTLHIDRAVGMTGIVYLSIPANQIGTGKVTVKVQNRTVEYEAVTRHEALPTGTQVQVVAVVGPQTVEVAAAQRPVDQGDSPLGDQALSR
jgi:hypothetical protein